MTTSHILGFPRIGSKRELKKAIEAYWRGELSLAELTKVSQNLQKTHWRIQADAGLDFVTVGDFSYYDHVLDMSALLGVIPERFGRHEGNVDINTIFCMARGQAPQVAETTACEMTKWFNTNYHYIVPEFTANQTFKISTDTLFKTIDEAQQLQYRVKPVLLGPLTYLWLGKAKDDACDKLKLLDTLLPAYEEIFDRLSRKNIEWVQIDEPILVLDLPKEWQDAYVAAYKRLNFKNLRCLLTTYFGAVTPNLTVIKQLPVQGLHIDLCAAPAQLPDVIAHLPKNCILSLGVINGRNIWRADLNKVINVVQDALQTLGENVWVASSSSLLHVPVDLAYETTLEPELKNWLAYATQKVQEIALVSQSVGNKKQTAAIALALAENKQAAQSRATSKRIHDDKVQKRLKHITKEFAQRKSSYIERAKKQMALLQLPLLPTTTIGSFPQTAHIRKTRLNLKTHAISLDAYTRLMREEIKLVIEKQEGLDLDVLVHGEPERNDMVEYFGELLQGFAFTENGWVQSYGSRCVKPPIIYGDISRPQPMTLEWIKYAQSLTKRYVKGMLTGPVTILAWSFVRDDQPHADTALQIALALRDEVTDLEKAGIKIIQIDEPAFREILPLLKKDWQEYFDWSVQAFRVAASGVEDHTQIHTHMCYSEFNDIIEAIAALDADVITLESSRSQMELLKAFEHYAYPNAIGPGVYDIHSPRIPSTEEIVDRLEKASQYIPAARLWVNPDCGLKTRGWPEVEAALQHMVTAAKSLRQKLKS